VVQALQKTWAADLQIRPFLDYIGGLAAEGKISQKELATYKEKRFNNTNALAIASKIQPGELVLLSAELCKAIDHFVK
jgi:hypothetical protein